MHRSLLIAGACAWAASSEELPYSEEKAVKYAGVAVAAYCGYPHSPDELLESWQCGPACDAVPDMSSVRVLRTTNNDDAFAFVGKLDSECVLSFRGTTNLPGWISDIESGTKTDLNGWGIDCYFDDKPCHVGRGFIHNYYHIAASVLGNLSDIGCGPGSDIIITGHSLGAAEAALAMMDLNNRGYTISQTYTFGQPRIGDESWVGAFLREFGNERVMRLTHYYDPVPRLPPTSMGFLHAPQEIFYERDSADGYHVCDPSGEDANCADQFWSSFMISECLASPSNCDHLSYLQGLVPFKMDGETCAGQSTNLVSV